MTASRAATLRLLARLPAAALARPRTQGAWSIKDVLVHIAAWEEEGARRLEAIRRGRGHGIRFYDTMAQVDRVNARAVRAARRLSAARVVARLARARARLARALARVAPGQLADPAHELPVVAWLREFAWTHETAHRREIRAWWRASRPPRGVGPQLAAGSRRRRSS
jgi:uncharacterized damage-inducible protein DinB